jgi:hypothetical protein
MADNLIRAKQINQADLSGAVQNVIASNQYQITYGGTGININNVGQITISGTDIYLIDSVFNVSGTGVFNALDLSNVDTLNLSGVNVNIISGNITLTNRPTVNGTGVLLSGEGSSATLPTTLVYTTGNQIISGTKRFVNSQTFFGPTGQISGTQIFMGDETSSFYNTISWSDGILGFIDSNGQSLNTYFDYPYSNNISLVYDFASGSPNARYTTLSIPKNKTGFIAVNQELVHNSGNEIISGSKTFVSSGIFSLSGAVPLGLPNNPLSVVGSGNTYLQINIQNRATGNTATADLVITANNGTDTTNYINLGINNSGYNDPTFSNGSGLDGYLFINGGSLDIGTQTANTNIEFHVGGTTLNKVIARINESGFNLVSGNFTYPVFSGATGFVFTPDASTSTFFDYTLSGSSTLNAPINMNNGQSITIFLTQDATGNRNMSFNSGYLFSNGITPSLNFLPSGTDILQVIKARNKLYSTFASNY